MNRRAGVLLHPSSLSGPEGIGTLGGPARALLDWMAMAGLQTWQMLPLCEGGKGNSPYSSPSSMVGSRWLIDLQDLVDQGLLPEVSIGPFPDGPVSYRRLEAEKAPRLAEAARSLRSMPDHPLYPRWLHWRATHPELWEVARFQVARAQSGDLPWWDWSHPLRTRDPKALAALERDHSPAIEEASILAFLFDHQWASLRSEAEEKGIEIFGDLPIYVSPDSAEIWTRPELFELDSERRPLRVAGVPPDAFSDTGQLWRNPLYDWEAMAAEDYAWWVERIRRSHEWCHTLRLDHFRGFSAYWAVPAGAETAEAGQWVEGPGRALFDRVRAKLGPLSLVAEDLGDIDEAVHRLRKETGLHCTRVLQFGLETDAANIHLPVNWSTDTVGYTGTHDNDTTVGWWFGLSDREQRAGLARLNREPGGGTNELIQAALESAAERVIFPMQDLLELNSQARMNTPGTVEGNWTWRLPSGILNDKLVARTHAWLARSSRIGN